MIHPFRNKLTICRYAAAGLALLFALTAEGASYPERAAGDEALSAGDYLLASRLYERHLNRVKDRGNSELERDAFERCIDSLIRCGAYDRADEIYTDYFVRHKGEDPVTAAILKAEILAGRKQYSEAESLLRQVLSALPGKDPKRKNALAAYARVCQGTGAWNDASAAYGELRNVCEDLPSRMSAHEQAVFCRAFSDVPLSALKELALLPEYVEKKPENARIFTIFAMLRAGTPMEQLTASWTEALSLPAGEGETIRYSLFSAIGDMLAEKKDWNNAALAYGAAYANAPDKTGAHETLKRLISVYENAGDLKKAAEPALLTYRLFEDKFVSAEQKFKIARLLRDAGKTEEAIEVYRNILASPLPAVSLRKAAEECAYLYGDTGRNAEAEKLTADFFTGTYASEGEMIRAEMLLRGKEYAKAAVAFAKISAAFPEKRDRADYQKILAMLELKDFGGAFRESARLEKEAGDPVIARRSVYLQGRSLEGMNRTEDAKKAYERYAAFRETEPRLETESLFKAGRFALKKSLYKDAEQCFRLILKKYPRSASAPAAGAWLVFALRAENEDLAAENTTWSIVREYPGSAGAREVLFDLASHNLEDGAVQRVRYTVSWILKQDDSPETFFRVSLLLSTALIRGGNLQEAKEKMDLLFSRIPEAKNSARALYVYADILKGSGRTEEACSFFEKAAAAAEKEKDGMTSAAATGATGDCYLVLAESSGKPLSSYERAIRCFQSVADMKGIPDSVRVMNLYKLGRSREILGQDDRARAAFREAVLLAGPDSPEDVLVNAAKSAECLTGIASRRPLRSHVDDAVRALRKMVRLKVLDHAEAEKRISELRNLQRNKKHF